MHALLASLSKLELVKVMDYKFSKAIWDMMRNFYEGDYKVKNLKSKVVGSNFNH